MRRILVVGTAMVVATLMASRGIAEEPSAEQTLRERFAQLDKNRDGKITTDELPQSAFFKQRDKNGDGVITLAEAMAFLADGAAAAETPIPPKASPMHGSRIRSRTLAASLRQGPQPLRPGERGVGRLVADAAFTDLAGKTHRLSQFSEQRALVIAMTSTSCPLSKKYLPTLARLAETYAQRGVTWVLVNPQATDKPAEMQAAAKSAGKAIYMSDPKGTLSQTVEALTTTDVIVMDGARTVVYHGAIDDQYGQGYSLDAPRHRYLADALDALLAGRTPLVAATGAPGCLLDLPTKPAAAGTLTYHNRISRIMQANCIECHREGGVGPFSLTTYEDVAAHAAMIKQVVEQGIMPPWFAAPPEETEDEHPSLWANDRSLETNDKTDILAWIAGGKPVGDERDAPRPRSFATGWLIGKPDAVFEFPEPVPVKASGVVPYHNVVLDTQLTEDKWIQAIEVQPGDRGVVHHMLVFLQPMDRKASSPSDEIKEDSAGFWGIYVAGNSTLVYPEGFAKRLPKGARLRCQVHYATNGTATTDRSRIGVIFAKKPPRHEVHVVGISNPQINIPAGANNHREEASLRIPYHVEVLSFLPHMHLRATACRYKVFGTDNKSRVLLDIPRYDFNWQLLYRYFEPQPLARDEIIKFTVWYDNSNQNPANPDPTQPVRWGRQISDEMHLGYVEYFVPGHKPGDPLPLPGGAR